MAQIIKTKLSENFNNISQKVKNYVANKVGFQQPPPIIQNIRIYQSPFKKSLTDWRKFNSKSDKKFTYDSALSPKNKQNSIVNQRRALSSYATNREKNCCTPNQTCRRTFTRENKRQIKTQRVEKKQSCLKFALVQNLIQNNLSHFSEKRVKTARIKKYYQQKNRQGITQFKIDLNLSNREGQDNKKTHQSENDGVKEIRKQLFSKRKSKLNLIPDEYYRNYNRAKILKRNLIKNERFLLDSYRQWSSSLSQYQRLQQTNANGDENVEKT